MPLSIRLSLQICWSNPLIWHCGKKQHGALVACTLIAPKRGWHCRTLRPHKRQDCRVRLQGAQPTKHTQTRRTRNLDPATKFLTHVLRAPWHLLGPMRSRWSPPRAGNVETEGAQAHVTPTSWSWNWAWCRCLSYCRSPTWILACSPAPPPRTLPRVPRCCARGPWPCHGLCHGLRRCEVAAYGRLAVTGQSRPPRQSQSRPLPQDPATQELRPAPAGQACRVARPSGHFPAQDRAKASWP